MSGRWFGSLRKRPLLSLAILLMAGGGPSRLAGQPPSAAAPAEVTAAQHLALRRTVALTGTVRSRRSSLVASEVAGLVSELTAREGDRVSKGEPLVRLRQEALELRLASAEGQLAEAQARLHLAVTRLERSRQLLEDEVISLQLFDDAISERDAWLGRTQQLEADVARLVDDLARSAIPAPFSGMVTREHTAPGQWLAIGAPVAELVDLDDLEIELAVPEAHFPRLAIGDAARVSFDSLPELEMRGVLSALIPRADDRARTYPVKVRLQGPDHRIGVGALARVELTVGDPVEVLAVPKDAIVKRPDGDVVFVVRDDTAVLVPVTVGLSQGQWTEVRGELTAGTPVVTRGNERLRPGQPVVTAPLKYPEP